MNPQLTPHQSASLLIIAAMRTGSLRLAAWDEGAHPRGERGRFGPGEGRQIDQLNQMIADKRAEGAKQQALADAQTNPLAHPDTVIGLGRETAATMRYVAAYGQQHEAAPLPVNIERGTPRECYKNASLMVMTHPELTYAEGFGKTHATGDLTFMHAWGVDKQGRVVDPTWDHPEKNQYFGVKYDRAYLQERTKGA